MQYVDISCDEVAKYAVATPEMLMRRLFADNGVLDGGEK
jgi:hypothetical protein